MATATKSKERKKAAPPNTLNVAFCWDMSGSMSSVTEATKEGTRGYLLDLQAEEKKLVKKNGAGVYTRLSLTAFDTVFEQWLVDQPIADVNVGTVISRYIPRGGTALYDAVANTIADLSKSLGDRQNEKCLMIVMTDGGENSSQEYGLHQNGKQKLFDLIKKFEAKGNWTFVYLGANVDAYAEATAMGISQGSSAYYSSTPGSVHAASASLSGVTSTLRSSAGSSLNDSFTDSGLSQDYRDKTFEQTEALPIQDWDKKSAFYADSSSASDSTKKAR